MRPETVADTLDERLVDGVGALDDPIVVGRHDAVNVTLAPDVALGVCLVVVTSSDHRHDDALDEVAVRIAATCFREELVRQAARDRPSGRTPDDSDA